MKRLYDSIIQSHLENDQEMLFLTGPRQVGKTTVSLHSHALSEEYLYLNYDDEDHRNIILRGPAAVINEVNIDKLSASKPPRDDEVRVVT